LHESSEFSTSFRQTILRCRLAGQLQRDLSHASGRTDCFPPCGVDTVSMSRPLLASGTIQLTSVDVGKGTPAQSKSIPLSSSRSSSPSRRHALSFVCALYPSVFPRAAQHRSITFGEFRLKKHQQGSAQLDATSNHLAQHGRDLVDSECTKPRLLRNGLVGSTILSNGDVAGPTSSLEAVDGELRARNPTRQSRLVSTWW